MGRPARSRQPLRAADARAVRSAPAGRAGRARDSGSRAPLRWARRDQPPASGGRQPVRRRCWSLAQCGHPLPDPDRPGRGIIVEDAGLDDVPDADDLVVRIREVIAALWPSEDGSAAEAIEAEAGEHLGVRSLRDYLRRPNGFFADHLSAYSKSRRQAPIYWPISTPSGAYTLWIYYPRLSDDLLYRAVTDYLDPKLSEVDRRLTDTIEQGQRRRSPETRRNFGGSSTSCGRSKPT